MGLDGINNTLLKPFLGMVPLLEPSRLKGDTPHNRCGNQVPFSAGWRPLALFAGIGAVVAARKFPSARWACIATRSLAILLLADCVGGDSRAGISEDEGLVDGGRQVFDGGKVATPADGSKLVDGEIDNCKTASQSLEGDGLYRVQSGDRITANNGVSIVVRGPGPDADNDDVHYFAVDFTIGENRLNEMPVHLENDSCTDYFGIRLDSISIQETGCGYKLDIEFHSLYPESIESLQDFYEQCRETGEVHSACSDFIPYEPASDETILSRGRFQVITPEDVDPIIGTYYLRQLELAYNPLLELFGVGEITPSLSLRWLLADGPISWPHTDRQIKWIPGWPGTEEGEIEFIHGEERGGLTGIASHPIVAHELAHLMHYGMALDFWLLEGLGRYAEVYATERPDHTPTSEMTVPPNSPFSIPGYGGTLNFTDLRVDSLGRTRILEETYGLWFHEESAGFTGGGLLAVESITEEGVTFRTFNDSSYLRENGWILEERATGFPNGYLKPDVIYVGNAPYALIRSGPYEEPVLLPYASLREREGEAGALYDTAFLLFDGLPRGVLGGFLAIANSVREDNRNDIPTRLCPMDALEEAADEELSEYLERFDPPTDCISYSESPRLYQGTRSCE